ncbi:MAG: hypothetical protein JNK47_02845 [Mesorhizobium sp.]|nr:hypothetical protein [Mesorhizobium sp.]MBL8576138.1 hypothetical protein [Mesorhizobium sp.]
MTVEEAVAQLRSAAKDAVLDYAETLIMKGVPQEDVMRAIDRYANDQLIPWYAEAIGRLTRYVAEPTAPTHRLQ